jgi:hypothetical protein
MRSFQREIYIYIEKVGEWRTDGGSWRSDESYCDNVMSLQCEVMGETETETDKEGQMRYLSCYDRGRYEDYKPIVFKQECD